MPPTDDRQTRPTNEFVKDIPAAIVLFETDGGCDHDRRSDTALGKNTQRIQTSFQVVYKPPAVTFRLQTHVFSKGPGGQEAKMSLYFDLPSHYVSSLAYTYSVDTVGTPELGQHPLGGAVTRLQFRLRRPGHFVTPLSEDYNLKASSQRVFDSMAALATVPEFALFVPRKLLTKYKLRSLQEAVASWTTLTRREAEDKAQLLWMGSLYGGAGGRVAASRESEFSIAAARAPRPLNSHEETTASEFGESTIATPTPPAYRRSMTPAEEDAAAAEFDHIAALLKTEDAPAAPACLPPYDLTQSEGTDNHSPVAGRSGLSEKLDGKRAAKRVRRDSEDTADSHLGQPHLAVLIAKVDQVLGRNQELEHENKMLQAQLAVVMSRTRALEEKHARLAQSHEELEANYDYLVECHEDLEERHEELVERQARLDERCDTIDVDIADHVHSALRERLVSALETMD